MLPANIASAMFKTKWSTESDQLTMPLLSNLGFNFRERMPLQYHRMQFLAAASDVRATTSVFTRSACTQECVGPVECSAREASKATAIVI
ncbi:MAG: hypothetical protein CME06_06020 [Gemmatimonadetes bacterium]|nr:hypothetical protein [Gemmatimonadota bacterium]